MREWNPITLTGRLITKPSTRNRSYRKGNRVWAYMQLENGEQHSVGIKMGEPFFDNLYNCKKGQIVTIYCLGNGRSLKNVSAFEAVMHAHARVNQGP